jgi:hypothetical protein
MVQSEVAVAACAGQAIEGTYCRCVEYLLNKPVPVVRA